MIPPLRSMTFAVVLLAVGCAPSFDPPLEPVAAAEPDSLTAERVIFLIGDAGVSGPEGSPLLGRLAAEVESWSGELARDSAVTVVFLGDNVYPNGVRGPDHPDRAQDSIRLTNQIDILAGPEAREHHSFGIFLPGNHDWGGAIDEEGAALLHNQNDLISARGAHGLNVELMPPPEEPGPTVLNLGERVKFVAMDTPWWLSADDTARRRQALQELKQAVDEPASRLILLAAHHPMRTGGPHGGHISFWPTLGIRKLVYLIGAGGQDLTAEPYREMIEDFSSAIAETEAPVVLASGHEHSLQVIEGLEHGEPQLMLISGSGSKSTPVRNIEGMLYGSRAHGFMRMIVGHDGAIQVEVVAETAEGYPTLWSLRIR